MDHSVSLLNVEATTDSIAYTAWHIHLMSFESSMRIVASLLLISNIDAGNFYLTWAPGQTTWQPHNRPAARRVQSMGWTPASELWLSVRGGDLFINDKSGPASEAFSQAKLGSRGFGILDVG